MAGQSDFIFELENALTGEQCDSLIARFEADPKKGPGRIAKGLNPDVKRTMDVTWPLEPMILDSLRPAMRVYHKLYPLLPKNIEAIAYMVMRYNPGDFYTWHNDAGSLLTMGRQYVAIWYLNDVEVGGNTEFLYLTRAIKPERGKLVLFPAGWTHAHRGAAPESGPKYIATAWLSLRGSYERQLGRDSAVSDNGLQGKSAPVCGAPEEGGQPVPHSNR